MSSLGSCGSYNIYTDFSNNEPLNYKVAKLYNMISPYRTGFQQKTMIIIQDFLLNLNFRSVTRILYYLY